MKYKLLVDGFGGKAGDTMHLSDAQVETLGAKNVVAVKAGTPSNKALTSDNVLTKDDLESKTVAELKEIADGKGIEYEANIHKADLIALLK